LTQIGKGHGKKVITPLELRRATRNFTKKRYEPSMKKRKPSCKLESSKEVSGVGGIEAHAPSGPTNHSLAMSVTTLAETNHLG